MAFEFRFLSLVSSLEENLGNITVFYVTLTNDAQNISTFLLCSFFCFETLIKCTDWLYFEN